MPKGKKAVAPTALGSEGKGRKLRVAPASYEELMRVYLNKRSPTIYMIGLGDGYGA